MSNERKGSGVFLKDNNEIRDLISNPSRLCCLITCEHTHTQIMSQNVHVKMTSCNNDVHVI